MESVGYDMSCAGWWLLCCVAWYGWTMACGCSVCVASEHGMEWLLWRSAAV